MHASVQYSMLSLSYFAWHIPLYKSLNRLEPLALCRQELRINPLQLMLSHFRVFKHIGKPMPHGPFPLAFLYKQASICMLGGAAASACDLPSCI